METTFELSKVCDDTAQMEYRTALVGFGKLFSVKMMSVVVCSVTGIPVSHFPACE
jgi:hypothetical protein